MSADPIILSVCAIFLVAAGILYAELWLRYRSARAELHRVDHYRRRVGRAK